MSTSSHGVAGILPVPGASLQKKDGNAQTIKNPAQPKLKLVLRRLPPGLTQTEFEAALGDEWKSGGGKIGWSAFRPGKVSRDLAKPSRPTRVYLHVTHQSNLQLLYDKVRSTNFNDARNTNKDAALVGPPVLESASYTRVPGGRKRNDARQGLIDQDSEFQHFLESLTNPAVKPDINAVASEGVEKKQVTTTPLIDHLREKKAAKEKAAKEKAEKAKTSGKHKREESKEERASEKKPDKKANKAGRDEASISDKAKKNSRSEKAAKEPVKVLSKESNASASDQTTAGGTAQAVKSPTKPRQRGSGALAAQILQRDLGIGPGAVASRRKRNPTVVEGAKSTGTAGHADNNAGNAAASGSTASVAPESARPKNEKTASGERKGKKDNKQTNVTSKANTQPAATPTILKKPPTGPAAQQRRNPEANAAKLSSSITTEVTPVSVTLQSQSPTPNRNAFLKHANSSQGITEPLIQEALSAFGPVESVEIDKRKGFAYVVFKSADALKAAIKGSPVKIANGAVVVLERREGKTSQQNSLNTGNSVPAGRGPSATRGRGSARGRGASGRGGGTPISKENSVPKITDSSTNGTNADGPAA